MTKPMKPREVWMIVDREGVIWKIADDKMYDAYAPSEAKEVSYRDAKIKVKRLKLDASYYAPFTVRRVLVTEIKKGKK